MVHESIDKVRVVLTSVVTIVTALAFAATTVAESANVPVVEHWAGQLAIWLAAAVTVLRRVTPVPAEERGILPVE